MRMRFVINSAVCFASIVVSLGIAEGTLRLMGHRPWRFLSLYHDQPNIHEPDPALGWRKRAGSYLLPSFHSTGKPTRVTFLDGSRRRTAENDVGRDGGALVLVGGSFTEGEAVGDRDTWAWKLQEAYPALSVLNYGTGGYGTYQSLLLLEQELPQVSSPRFVLYGFILHHEVRNVAPHGWLRTMAMYSRDAPPEIPFATIDDRGLLVRHLPIAYSAWPLRQRSALVTWLEERWMQSLSAGRWRQRRPVTERILLELQRVSAGYGATLGVALLSCPDAAKAHYTRFLQDHDVEVMDCTFELSPELRVKGQGHPGAKAHTKWARCIEKHLTPFVAPPGA